MGVILQATYRQGLGISVPCPIDLATPDVAWWYDHIAAQANAFAASGFTAVLLPPVLKTSAGLYPDADGYGPYDDYDIGSKVQNEFYTHPQNLTDARLLKRLKNVKRNSLAPKSGIEDRIAQLEQSVAAPPVPTPIPSPLMATRFGDRTQLQRLAAICHANGIDVYLDQVPHQRSGGRAGVYRYPAAGGAQAGAFPKNPGCFVIYQANGELLPGCVERDPIAGPVADDFAFGDELCPINAVPPGYVMQGLIDAGDWITRTLGIDGYRDDDVKGQAIAAVTNWANARSMAGKIVIGEYDDGNTANVNWWIWATKGRCYAFDFPLHYVLEAMCNQTSNWNMAQLDHAGVQGVSPLNAVTFVENPDTDTDGFASIIWNKILAYCYILTSEGYPMVYYRDYSNDPGCYGLKSQIDNLIYIHEHFANGTTWFRYKSYQVVAYERGPGNLLVTMNNDMYNGWATLTNIPTGFGPNVWLHDLTGHNQMDCQTNMWGEITLGVPPNVNGQGYGCWVPRQPQYPANKIIQNSITQTFFGGPQYDIGPAVNGVYTLPFPITCGQGLPMSVTFTADRTGWSTMSTVEFQVIGHDSQIVARGTLASVGTATAAGISEPGVHTLRVIGTMLPAAGSSFAFTVTYTAPQTFIAP